MKSHKDYFNITDRKINQDNIFKKIQKKYFFRINNLKKKIKKREVLIISNFTNKNLLSREDRYFHHIVKQLEIEKKDFNIIYRNLNNYKINQTKKYNFYILNNNSKITKDLYYLFKILVEIFKIIFSKINKLFYKTLIIKNLLKIKNITSSIHNLNHVDDLMEQIKIAKPKKIFLTYEGYPWERLLCKKIKDFDEKIVIFGYFFSVMLKYTNTPLLKLNNSFDPDIILTPSSFISQSFLKKNFKKKVVINIGSIKSKDFYLPKNNKKDKNRQYINCLILPESYDNEVKFLINFAKKTLDQKLKIKYLLRLHPNINNKKYLADIKNYIGKYNISLSSSSLNNDINNSNITFYRGSSSVIEAASKGLIPLYIKKQNELSLDVLYKLEKFKPKIRSMYDFYNFYNIYKMKDHSYNKKNNDKIIDYCRSYYSLINKKKISKIINYKY